MRLFERAHPSPPDLSLWWFLNVGLSLPDDLARLRATVEKHRLDLLILDSFYSVVFGIDLKDSEAEQIIVLLKREIADPTGCTVLIVDHMPWATDSNRGRLRGYGGVHKGAAIRFGIYVDAEGKKLYVEARGNNIKGFKKTPAHWDEDALELRLVDVKHVNEAELDERVLGYLSEHGWSSGNVVEKRVTGGGQSIRESLLRLEEARRITKCSASELGRAGRGNYWNLSTEAASGFVSLLGTNLDEPAPGDVTNEEVRLLVPPPKGGRTSSRRTSSGLRDDPALPGDDVFLAFLLDVGSRGLITETEYTERADSSRVGCPRKVDSVTALQKAQMLAVPAYRAALKLLQTREERDALRDTLAAALAADYLEEIGEFGIDDVERAA